MEFSYVCGGTIISKNWILTSAGCCELGTGSAFGSGITVIMNYDTEDEYQRTAKVSFSVQF